MSISITSTTVNVRDLQVGPWSPIAPIARAQSFHPLGVFYQE